MICIRKKGRKISLELLYTDTPGGLSFDWVGYQFPTPIFQIQQKGGHGLNDGDSSLQRKAETAESESTEPPGSVISALI